MSTQCFTWSEADFTWIGNEYTWNDACLVIEVATGGLPFENYNKLPEKKKEQFITLILKVKGETIKQTKKKKKYKVTAKDIKLVINTVLKEVNITLEK